METAASMIVLVGTQQVVNFEEIGVLCKIVDTKYSWGNLTMLVEPVGGIGQQWVSTARICGRPQ